MAPAEKVDRSAWTAIAVLACGTFVFVTGELLPVGLLPSISADLGVSIGTAGLLVTGYAAIVVLTAVPFTALSARLPRKGLLLCLLAVHTVGSAIAAVAPSYAVLLGARVFTALAHGIFWSVIAVLAARLAGAGAGRATAAVFAGASVAVVAGVPVTTFLGQQLGWRAGFALLSLAGAVLIALTARVIPRMAAEGENTLSALPGLLSNRGLRVTVAVTGLLVTAHFTAFTYVAPLLEDVTGLAPATVSALLLLIGASGLAGTLLSGRLADRDSYRAVKLVAAGLLAALLALWLALPVPLPAVLVLAVWGFVGAGIAVILQTRVLHVAGASGDAASSFYVAVFNLGIGGGALLGAQLIPLVGLENLPLAGAAFAAAGLAAALVRNLQDEPAVGGTVGAHEP